MERQQHLEKMRKLGAEHSKHTQYHLKMAEERVSFNFLPIAYIFYAWLFKGKSAVVNVKKNSRFQLGYYWHFQTKNLNKISSERHAT